jgi:Diacylglycerol kinase catalytic domain
VAAGADALGMAGGDGSLAVVAAVAAAHGIPFVCVPAGTRNHFALDVGVDRHDVIGALDAFTDGVERQIDVAEVNGRAFLNNASLGIYGDAVRSPAYRDAKVRTLVETAAEVMGPSAEAPALCLVDDLGREHRDLVVVLVSNNPYALDRPLARGTRPTLGGGQLGIVVTTRPPTARALQGEPGARRVWRSVPRNRSTPELTAKRWNSVRRCGSLSGRRRCGSGSPHVTRGASPSARLPLPGHPPRSQGRRGLGARNQQGPAPIRIRLHPENPRYLPF